MKLSYRNQLIIASVAVVLLAAIVIALLIVPQFSQLSSLDTQIDDARNGVSQAQTLLAQRQEIKARAAQTEATRLRLANQIPENPELPSLIVELQDTINAAGLEFASITPLVPATELGQPFSTIGISVIVRGGWQDTVDLLQRLRSLTRQFRIVSFSVVRTEPVVPEGEEPEDLPNEVEAVISLEVYTMPAAVVAPVVPTTPPSDDPTLSDEAQ